MPGEPTPLSIDKAARSASLGQTPFVLWLTGIPGAGKSTLANLADRELHERGHHSYVLDGDILRRSLNRDLGFAAVDRVENVRRVTEVARLMVDAGLIVIASLISPFRDDREAARARFEDAEFIEIHVDAPLSVAEARDPKGLYARARRGEVSDVTGIDSPYEPPERPELRIDTVSLSPRESLAAIVEVLATKGLIAGDLPDRGGSRDG